MNDRNRNNIWGVKWGGKVQRIRSSDREALEEFWSTPKVIVVAWSDRAIEATTEILIATACLTTFTRRSVCVCVCEWVWTFLFEYSFQVQANCHCHLTGPPTTAALPASSDRCCRSTAAAVAARLRRPPFQLQLLMRCPLQLQWRSWCWHCGCAAAAAFVPSPWAAVSPGCVAACCSLRPA